MEQRKQVTHGTDGSSRPDFHSSSLRLSIDVKNYDLRTPRGRDRLSLEAIGQVRKRVVDLPAGTRQGLMLDVRGQKLTAAEMERVRGRLVEDSGGSLAPDNIHFMTE